MNEKRCCILHSSFNFFSFSSICTIYLISNFNFLFLSCDNKPIICRNDCQRNLPDNALQTETSSRVMCSCWIRIEHDWNSSFVPRFETMKCLLNLEHWDVACIVNKSCVKMLSQHGTHICERFKQKQRHLIKTQGHFLNLDW